MNISKNVNLSVNFMFNPLINQTTMSTLIKIATSLSGYLAYYQS